MSNIKKWLGSKPNQCDICSTNMQDESYFVDGRTTRGPWALMCPSCHRQQGVGLGTGHGQQYDTKPPYYKTGG